MQYQEEISKEVDYKAVLSSGPGGQHANKTSTKVVLSWDLENTEALEEDKKKRLQFQLQKKLTKTGVLQLSADHTRSQHKNKEIVTKRFFKIIEDALKIPTKRKKTKPSRKQKLQRLKNKKIQSEKKSNRKDPLK